VRACCGGELANDSLAKGTHALLSNVALASAMSERSMKSGGWRLIGLMF
jgi:hypothetical protein